MIPEDGGPMNPPDSIYSIQNQGLSIRDWFAGMSLMGRRANPALLHIQAEACDCYADADAMIAEREKEKS